MITGKIIQTAINIGMIMLFRYPACPCQKANESKSLSPQTLRGLPHYSRVKRSQVGDKKYHANNAYSHQEHRY